MLVLLSPVAKISSDFLCKIRLHLIMVSKNGQVIDPLESLWVADFPHLGLIGWFSNVRLSLRLM
jgi:hypothetical protein